MSIYRSSFTALFACFSLLPAPSARASDTPATRISPSASSSQLAPLAVPIAGYVATSSPPAIRPILGVVGALAVGEPIRFAPEASLLAISPDQSRLLIGRGYPASLSIAALGPNGIGSESTIPGALTGADMASFSPSGDCVAVRSTQLGTLQVIAGLGSSPRITFEIDAAAFASEVRSIAVSDDGAFVIIGSSDGQAGSVRFFSKDGPPAVLLHAGNPSSIQLLKNSSQAIIVDAAWNQVTLLEGLGRKVASRVFPSPPGTEASSLDGAILSADGGILFVLRSSHREAYSVNLGDGSAALSAFPSAAVDSGRLAGTPFSVRSSADGKSAWLVDFSGLEPVSRYIPPIPDAQNASSQEVEK